jgi:hypothetical protein
MYVKELLSSRSFSLDVSSSPRLARLLTVVRSIVASSGRPGFELPLASPEKESQLFREYTEEEKSSFELTHFQWKEGRKERRIDESR